MLGRGLTSVGAEDGIVDIQVRCSGSSVGILVVNVGSVSRKDDGSVLSQLTIKPLWKIKLNSGNELFHKVNGIRSNMPD